jgi:hypothetical protein
MNRTFVDEADMAAEPVAKKGMLWLAVAAMFFISCLLTASGVLEFVQDGNLSLFGSLEIVIGGSGIIVTLVAWLLTLAL